MAISFRRHRTPGAAVPGAGASIRITAMHRRHVKEVVDIERTIFPQPWSPTLYLSELALGSATRRYYVALSHGAVVGYAGCMVMVGEGHVTTIGVAEEWQGHGIGKRLLYQLARDARSMNAEALTLEVRMTNTSAQELYRTFGFVPAGIRKNYYAEINEDGLVMWAHDIQSEEYERRLDEIGVAITKRLVEEGEASK